MRSRNSQLVLAVASHGGHWVQMRRLMSAFEGLPIHYVSTTAGVAHEVAPFPVSVVRDANLQDKVALVRLALETFWIVIIKNQNYMIKISLMNIEIVKKKKRRFMGRNILIFQF